MVTMKCTQQAAVTCLLPKTGFTWERSAHAVKRSAKHASTIRRLTDATIAVNPAIPASANGRLL